MTVNAILMMVMYIWNCSPSDEQHELIACRTIALGQSAPETHESLMQTRSLARVPKAPKPPKALQGESFIKREERSNKPIYAH